MAKNGDGEFVFFICQIRHFAIGPPPPDLYASSLGNKTFLKVSQQWVIRLHSTVRTRGGEKRKRRRKVERRRGREVETGEEEIRGGGEESGERRRGEGEIRGEVERR